LGLSLQIPEHITQRKFFSSDLDSVAYTQRTSIPIDSRKKSLPLKKKFATQKKSLPHKKNVPRCHAHSNEKVFHAY